MSKLGVLLPKAKSFPDGGKPLLLITKGPGKGTDLAAVTGSTPQLIGKNASKKLWFNDEIKNHMLSPKSKQKEGVPMRTDFSPTRKELFKGYLNRVCYMKNFVKSCDDDFSS